MAKYIDKDALVAEIEKLKDNAHNGVLYHQSRQNIGLENELSTWEHLESAFATVLKILDTFEVKDVDLKKELIKWHKEHFKKDGTFIGMSGFYLTNNSQMDIAKHFFELGMAVSNKTQKGE